MEHNNDNDADGPPCKRSRTADGTTNDAEDCAVVTPTNGSQTSPNGQIERLPPDLRKWMNAYKGDQEQMLAYLCKFKHDPVWWKTSLDAADNDIITLGLCQ